MWDAPTTVLTDRALDLAARCDDAHKAARLRAEVANHSPFVERITALAAVRWRLAGRLDGDPGDLVALAALGLVALAALEPA